MPGKEKMGFNATWSMAVGGMVGGGIFSVLGVVVETAGQWAWLSFVIAGIIALISAYSYSQLAEKFSKSGGSFTYLRQIDQPNLAGNLAWILIIGYALTISVYSYTFGHYVAHVVSGGAWLPRALALAIIGVLAWVNLRGLGDTQKVEIITVWGKLFVLVGLAVIGLWNWNSAKLVQGNSPKGIAEATVGAAIIFMAYEGFQLLAYDYNDIADARKNMSLATLTAVGSVILIYVAVTLGTTMLVGPQTIIAKKEIALAIAGKKALGTPGLVIVTIAAAFSTASAINATLFSTGRLMESIAQKKELPGSMASENKKNIPYAAILTIAVSAAALAMAGSLEMLVNAASLIFLGTFGLVNGIAFQQKVRYRGICLAGAVGALLATLTAGWHQFQQAPGPIIGLICLIILVVIFRPVILKKLNRSDSG